MEPPMNNLTVDFLTLGTGAGTETDGSTLAVRAGTNNALSGTYALLVFDSERCASDALCVMSTNLTSASATTRLGLRTVHELLASGSQSSSSGILQLPEDIDSADGTMRLLFNTTGNAAPANAADLLSAPWSNDRVVAGSEDTKPRKCSSRSRRSRRRCRSQSLSGLGNGTLDALDGNTENAAERPVVRTAFGWAVAGFVMLVVA
ncbi:hypothetical protein CC80DRAFT_597890 [Byssothecium circinans]|uniref:Uncharacterized protein n=1 Tax=Byssothecium circinans TaxID=147558 RepID=A0A6A5TER7_9PLEO|nr:hypothetical protein CC80DRAFT_597890 [Byssothecium circinans]